MILDGWVNVFPEGFKLGFGAQASTAGVHELFGDDVTDDMGLDSLLASMDSAGGDVAMLTRGRRPAESARRRGTLAAEDFLDMADRHAGRFLVSATVEKAGKPLEN